MAKKVESSCAVSRSDFTKKAKPILVEVDGNKLAVNTKEFSTGSFGWFANSKAVVMVDGVPVNCTVQVQVVVNGSKDA